MNFHLIVEKNGTFSIQTEQARESFGKNARQAAKVATQLLTLVTLNREDNSQAAAKTATQLLSEASAEPGKPEELVNIHNRKSGLKAFSHIRLEQIRGFGEPRRETFLSTLGAHEKKVIQAFFKENPAKPARGKDISELSPWVAAIRRAMEDQGYTQADLADAFGVAGQQTVGHYMVERRAMSIPQLLSVCEFLGLEPGQVLKGEAVAATASD